MQRSFPFLATCKKPAAAPDWVVSAVQSEHQAVAVSLSGVNARIVAKTLKISGAYLSQIRHGDRPIPDWFVKPFCYATGTALLQQWIDMQEALAVASHKETESALVKRLARNLERAA